MASFEEQGPDYTPTFPLLVPFTTGAAVSGLSSSSSILALLSGFILIVCAHAQQLCWHFLWYAWCYRYGLVWPRLRSASTGDATVAKTCGSTIITPRHPTKNKSRATRRICTPRPPFLSPMPCLPPQLSPSTAATADRSTTAVAAAATTAAETAQEAATPRIATLYAQQMQMQMQTQMQTQMQMQMQTQMQMRMPGARQLSRSDSAETVAMGSKTDETDECDGSDKHEMRADSFFATTTTTTVADTDYAYVHAHLHLRGHGSLPTDIQPHRHVDVRMLLMHSGTDTDTDSDVSDDESEATEALPLPALPLLQERKKKAPAAFRSFEPDNSGDESGRTAVALRYAVNAQP